MKIRDLRKKDQYKIDDKYLNGYARVLGLAATGVYNSLSRHAEFNTQEAFPSEEKIGEEHGITARTVRTAIKRLSMANIVNIKRERTEQGKWLNNLYILVDKSEWRKPEEINDIWKTRGKKQHNPEENKDKTRGSQRPIKDTHIKDTHIKEIAVQSPAPWDFKKYLEEMNENKQRHINIIAFYLEEKGLKFESKEQVQAAIKRHLRAAKDLVPFTDKQITAAAEQAKKEYPRIWTIETLVKILTRENGQD